MQASLRQELLKARKGNPDESALSVNLDAVLQFISAISEKCKTLESENTYERCLKSLDVAASTLE